jgi:hypothetical protein
LERVQLVVVVKGGDLAIFIKLHVIAHHSAFAHDLIGRQVQGLLQVEIVLQILKVRFEGLEVHLDFLTVKHLERVLHRFQCLR